MDHVGHLFLVVADFVRAVVCHHRQCRSHHAVDLARFAPAVALAMEGGEVGHQVRGVFRLAAEKDPLPGNEDVVEDHRRSVLGIALVAAVAAGRSEHIAREAFAMHPHQRRRITGQVALDQRQIFQIGQDVRVTIVKIDRNTVRIGIEAPDKVTVYREEIVPAEAERRRRPVFGRWEMRRTMRSIRAIWSIGHSGAYLTISSSISF